MPTNSSFDSIRKEMDYFVWSEQLSELKRVIQDKADAF